MREVLVPRRVSCGAENALSVSPLVFSGDGHIISPL
jgi:hypothetical protein